jgi:hypothetical protein
MAKTNKIVVAPVAPGKSRNPDLKKKRPTDEPKTVISFTIFISPDCLPRDFCLEEPRKKAESGKKEAAQRAGQPNMVFGAVAGSPGTPGHGGGLGAASIAPMKMDAATLGDSVPPPTTVYNVPPPGHGGGLGVTVSVVTYPPPPDPD